MSDTVLWKFLLALLLVFLLVPVCRSDLKTRTIPNRWTVLLGGCGLLAAVLETIFDLLTSAHSTGFAWPGMSPFIPFLLSAAGALTGGGLGLLCRGVSRDGFGWGDVKLLVALGAYLRLFPFLQAMALTGVLSLLTALFLLAIRHASPSDKLPFAPFLAAGAVLSAGIECFL